MLYMLSKRRTLLLTTLGIAVILAGTGSFFYWKYFRGVWSAIQPPFQDITELIPLTPEENLEEPANNPETIPITTSEEGEKEITSPPALEPKEGTNTTHMALNLLRTLW